MIKEQINITCGDVAYENCTLIVPSQVLTSTPQEETLDLEKSPNFQIVVPAAYIDKGTYEVTFSVGGNDCTANMIVVNNGSVNCTLQYVDGLIVEEADSSDDSSDDEPTGPLFTNPVNGQEIVGELTAEDVDTYGGYHHSITMEGVSLDDMGMYLSASGSVSVGSTYDDETSTTTDVFMIIPEGSGSCTLTYDDNEHDAVSVTFTYNITSATPEQPTFTYSGSDQNDPIICNVNLADYSEEFADTYPEVNINFVAPSSDYQWTDVSAWENAQELYSDNNNDCMLAMWDMFGIWTLGSGGSGYTGPQTTGTYIRSYSVTFNYDINHSNKFDETTGNSIDDPVAQSLDGTTITFWVQFNVGNSGVGK